MKLENLLIPHIEINSEWIKDLNVRPETIKILEKNTGSKILNIAHSNILSDISPQAREMRKNKQMKLYRTKKFLHSRRNHQQNKKTILRMGENIYTNTSDKGLITKIYKEFTKLTPKKTTQLKNGQRTLLQRGHTDGQ